MKIDEIETNKTMSVQALEGELRARDTIIAELHTEMRRVRACLEPHYVAANRPDPGKPTVNLTPSVKLGGK